MYSSKIQTTFVIQTKAVEWSCPYLTIVTVFGSDSASVIQPALQVKEAAVCVTVCYWVRRSTSGATAGGGGL